MPLLMKKKCSRCEEEKGAWDYYPKRTICKDCMKKAKTPKPEINVPKGRLVPYFRPKFAY